MSENTLSGELLLKPEDIGRVAGLDVNNDGSLTWGEVNRNHNQMMKIRHLSFLATFLFYFQFATGQTKDAGLWSGIAINKKITKKIDASMLLKFASERRDIGNANNSYLDVILSDYTTVDLLGNYKISEIFDKGFSYKSW